MDRCLLFWWFREKLEDDQEFQVVGDISELQAQAEAEGSKDEATSSGNANQSAAIGNTSVFKLLQTEKNHIILK